VKHSKVRNILLCEISHCC